MLYNVVAAVLNLDPRVPHPVDGSYNLSTESFADASGRPHVSIEFAQGLTLRSV